MAKPVVECHCEHCKHMPTTEWCCNCDTMEIKLKFPLSEVSQPQHKKNLSIWKSVLNFWFFFSSPQCNIIYHKWTQRGESVHLNCVLLCLFVGTSIKNLNPLDGDIFFLVHFKKFPWHFAPSIKKGIFVAIKSFSESDDQFWSLSAPKKCDFDIGPLTVGHLSLIKPMNRIKTAWKEVTKIIAAS